MGIIKRAIRAAKGLSIVYRSVSQNTMYHITIIVSYNNLCIILQLIYHTTLIVPYNTPCII